MVSKRAATEDMALPLASEPLPASREAQPERFSTKSDRQEFFLPVTGFVWFYPEEVEGINHPAFQRLGRINQLGQAYVVFPRGTPKRIDHVPRPLRSLHQNISALLLNP